MLMVRGCSSDHREGASGTSGEGLDLTRRDPLLWASLRLLNSNQSWRAESSFLICTNFYDKLNLKIQPNCNQQSKPTRKSLASLGALRAISDPNGVRKFAGLRWGTGALHLCPQHELRHKTPRRAPSVPTISQGALGKATACQGRSSGLG